MAGKQQVVLTFAGDSSKLTSEFDKVGSSAKSMGDDVGRSSKKVGDSTDGFDKLGGGLDNTYNKADALEAVGRGTADTMSGLGEIMKGNVLQGSTDLAGGVAALADGFAGALIPGLKAGVTWLKSTTVAQKALNLAQRMSPIGMVITGLVILGTLLVLLWKRSETFRNIVRGAMSAVATAFGWITKGFGAAWSAVSGAWNRFAAWVSGWKGAVTSRVRALFGAYVTAFGAAWSAVSGAWTRFLGWVAGWRTSILNRVSSMFSAVGSAFGAAWGVVSNAWGRFLGWVAGWRTSIFNRVGSIFSGIGSAFGAAWGVVSNAWTRFAGWVQGWKRALSFGGMFDGIIGAAKSAFNWLISKWNNLSFSLPAVDTHLPGVGKIGGWTLHTPNIPTFHTGGIMPGAPGTEGLALLQAGERVTPAGQSGGRVEVVLRVEGRGSLADLLRNELRGRGITVEGLTT